ncbi:hypothetical protein D3C80_1513340 [compost metagenome]
MALVSAVKAVTVLVSSLILISLKAITASLAAYTPANSVSLKAPSSVTVSVWPPALSCRVLPDFLIRSPYSSPAAGAEIPLKGLSFTCAACL